MPTTDTLCEHDVVTTAGETPYVAWRRALSCRDCARNVLSMLLNGSDWVIRRVEHVRFCDDRAASRRVSMDFVIPSEAPGYRISPDEHVRLIPLTMMRRKTLVSFGVADVDGRALSLMSMRHTQALTFEMICVLAQITLGRDHSEEVRQFARLIAFGNQRQLEEAFARAAAARSERPDSDLSVLMNDEGARRMIRRLADNFVLLVTVEQNGPARRIIRFAYDEPLSLRYRHSRFDRSSKTLERVARPAPRKQRLAWIGWEPTAIRFPVPAAEYTLSYHFEVEAPPGAVITEASLVAGRPGREEASRLSWDYVADRLPVVGLHAVEVPNGSISGVQVLLRPSARGWLFTNALAALLSCLLLVATAVRSLSGEQAQLVTGAIFAISAAFIVFIVQPGEHQMVSRLVAGVRFAMATLIGLLVVAGIAIILLAHTRTLLVLLCVAALACTVLIVAVFWRAQRAQKSVHISPWEQGVDIEVKGRALDPGFTSLEDAHERFGYDKPAIMVQTAEAEHLEEPWTENVDRELRARLDRHRPRSYPPTAALRRSAAASRPTPSPVIPAPADPASSPSGLSEDPVGTTRSASPAVDGDPASREVGARG